MTNTTQSHWQDQISLLPTRPERAVVRTEWLAKLKAFIETNPLTQGAILDWLRESGLLLNRDRTPRFEDWHYENQASVHGALSTAVIAVEPLQVAEQSVSNEWGLIGSNALVGNSLIDFDLHFEGWRRPEKNEIPRQVLRAEVVQQFQVLIESMGSFRPRREERVVADENMSTNRQESVVLSLFGQG